MPQPNQAVATPDRILRMKVVLERTGLSRSTLYRKLAAGTFPRQIQISERCIGWRESAIDTWLRDPTQQGDGQKN